VVLGDWCLGERVRSEEGRGLGWVGRWEYDIE
jgi:hypothetical protein